MTIREGAEKGKQIIVYRVIVAMLRLSRRPGSSEMYTLCPFQLCGFTSTLYDMDSEMRRLIAVQ